MARRPDKVVDLAAVRAIDADLAALRDADPERFAASAERATAWLAGELPGPGFEEADTMRTKYPAINLRVTQETIDRADALAAAPAVRQVAELAAATNVTQSAVLRTALLRGLASLEAELAGKAGGKKG